MIYFRCDGNSNIGVGHVMRSLSLAKAFCEQDKQCRFIMADDTLAELVRSNGFEVDVLETDYCKMDEETDKLLRILDDNAEFIIIDSYYVTPGYFKRMGQVTKIVYIDDLNKQPYSVDVIINYNIYAHKMKYETSYGSKDVKMLLGTRYALLRKEFANVEKNKTRQNKVQVLVSTGGADTQKVLGRFVNRIDTDKYHDVDFHLLIGMQNQERDSVIERVAPYSNMHIHSNVKKMKELMCNMDIAISAAGSTLYELCACGVPVITYVCADNQIAGAACFHEIGIMKNAGDVRDGDQAIDNIMKYLDEYIEDESLRLNKSEEAKQIVDGNGAKRCAVELINYLI